MHMYALSSPLSKCVRLLMYYGDFQRKKHVYIVAICTTHLAPFLGHDVDETSTAFYLCLGNVAVIKHFYLT
jgi:hypothetical protein